MLYYSDWGKCGDNRLPERIMLLQFQSSQFFNQTYWTTLWRNCHFCLCFVRCVYVLLLKNPDILHLSGPVVHSFFVQEFFSLNKDIRFLVGYSWVFVGITASKIWELYEFQTSNPAAPRRPRRRTQPRTVPVRPANPYAIHPPTLAKNYWTLYLIKPNQAYVWLLLIIGHWFILYE